MGDLRADSQRLRGLMTAPPTDEARRTVRVALGNKREGIQSVALQVLGAWGGRDVVETIRAFLVTALARPYGWSIRGVAVRALAPHLGGRDTEWVLDLIFAQPSNLLRHELLPLVANLDPKRARRRLVPALVSPHALDRWTAARAVGAMPFEDRAALLTPLLDDEHDMVANTARIAVKNASPPA